MISSTWRCSGIGEDSSSSVLEVLGEDFMVDLRARRSSSKERIEVSKSV